MVEKATTRQKGPLGPPSEFGDPLVTRCGTESQHSAESWAPGSQVEHQENEKDTMLMAIRAGVNILQFCLVQLPLTHKIFQIKWEVYFSKRLCRSSLLLRQYVFCMYMCIVVAYDYTTFLYDIIYFLPFCVWKNFLSLDLLTFTVHNLGRL